MKKKFLWLFVVCLASWASIGLSQTVPAEPKVHMIYMGGNDCPPCVVWRGLELPKLQQTESFKTIKFSYVTKLIRSTVPASLFLPSEVKPFKDKLDIASGGRAGSPQFAILVDGVVYDYYFGTRSAQDVDRMLIAIRDQTEYPFKRCTKRGAGNSCVSTD